jgi:hypothetical protein
MVDQVHGVRHVVYKLHQRWLTVKPTCPQVNMGQIGRDTDRRRGPLPRCTTVAVADLTMAFTSDGLAIVDLRGHPHTITGYTHNWKPSNIFT